MNGVFDFVLGVVVTVIVFALAIPPAARRATPPEPRVLDFRRGGAR